uniref:PET100 cytochrome c oxidase chaperone n=1 Tax=Salvator merianae TaxID=96440 RepID=A0A8D0BK09_SALMN
MRRRTVSPGRHLRTAFKPTQDGEELAGEGRRSECSAAPPAYHARCQAQDSDIMGVKLEVFRMMLYLSFPVAMFWVSNQAGYFEEYVVKRKREIFPPDDSYQKKALEDLKERMRMREEQRLLQANKE